MKGKGSSEPMAGSRCGRGEIGSRGETRKPRAEPPQRLCRPASNVYYKLRGSAKILLYHRVVDMEEDPQAITVSPDNFERQVLFLQQHHEIVPLRRLVEMLRAHADIRNLFVITFDDGYKDNYVHAVPILEKHRIPATFFVTVGMLEGDAPFWWDELEKLVLQNENRSESLRAEVSGRVHEWVINTQEKADEAYRKLHLLLKYLPSQEREEVMRSLRSWAGAEQDTRVAGSCMDEKDVVEISRRQLFEIGAHTMTHTTLSTESMERQGWEIGEAKKRLEGITGRRIESFSYPFGCEPDVGEGSKALVRECGYRCGLANTQRNVYKSADIFWLSRRIVRNWGEKEFMHSLREMRRSDRPISFRSPRGGEGG